MGIFDDLKPKRAPGAGGPLFAGLDPAKKEVEINGVPVSQLGTMDRIGYGLASAISRPLAGLGQATGIASDDWVRETEARAEAIRNTGAGKAAGVVGDIGMFLLPASKISTLGTVGKYAGNAALGMGVGALDPVTEEGESRLKNAAIGGALGLGGQAAGDALAVGGKALSNTVAPEVKALYQAAKARGINLTPAQLSDSKFMRFLSSQLGALPGSGAAGQAAKQSRQFNTAAARLVGESEPMSREVFDHALTRIGGNFDKFTNRPLPLTNGFMRNVLKVQEEAAAIGDGDSARNMKAIADRIFKQGTSGTLDGRAVQSIDSALSKLQAAGGERSAYATQMRNALHDHLEKNMPRADFDAWRKTRGEYRNAMRMMGLVAKDGEVVPGKLMGAVTANKAGKRAMARNRGGDLGELAKIGQRMKPPPSSGTGERVQAAAVGTGMWTNPIETLAGISIGRLARGVTDSDTLASALMNRGRGMQAIAPYVPAAGLGVMRYPYVRPSDDGP